MRMFWPFGGVPRPLCHFCPGQPVRAANGFLLCFRHAAHLDAQSVFAFAAGARFLIVFNERVTV